MYFALSLGHTQIGTAAGTFEELEVFTLTPAVFIGGKLIFLSGLPAQKLSVFRLSLLKLPGESADKAQNNLKYGEIAEYAGENSAQYISGQY